MRAWVEVTGGEWGGLIHIHCHHCGESRKIPNSASAVREFNVYHSMKTAIECRHHARHGPSCYCKRPRPKKKRPDQLVIPGA